MEPVDVFVERLVELKRFVWEEGRLPRESDGGVGRWLLSMRAGASPGEAAVLDEWVPGWRWSFGQERLLAMVSRLVAFRGEHGRYPRPGESLDGRWLMDQRLRTSVEVGSLLDERCPGWRG